MSESTNLIVLWPDAGAPSADAAVAALRDRLGPTVEIAERLPADDSIEWCVAVTLPPPAASIMLWCEPAQPLDAEDRAALDVPEGPPPRWVLGVEAVLGGRDPLAAFHALVAAITVAFPDVPALLDVNTGRWFPRATLDEWFTREALEPPADVLWVTESLEWEDREGVALRTRGLARCGRPELEMDDVPPPHVDAAAEVLDGVAALLLEEPPVSAAALLEIGPELEVALRPRASESHETHETHKADEPEEADASPSVVVCIATGSGDDAWRWPREVVERCAGEGAAVYVTERATKRQATLARIEWEPFARAFAATEGHAGETRFAVKAGFGDAEDQREHVWFEVVRIDGRVTEGLLLHEPSRELGLQKGDRARLDLAQLSDWRIVTARGAIGPEEADQVAITAEGGAERGTDA